MGIALQSESDARPLAPRPVTMVNSMARRFGRSGKAVLEFDPNGLMADAERITRLDDWGDDEFLPALQAMCDSLQNEAQLSLLGRMMLASGMRRFLANRLRMQRDWKRYPQILETPISRPIFIVGFPRTGSTLMQRLLARDPNARSLRLWEMMEPSPVGGRLSSVFDHRPLAARSRIGFLNWAAPNFAAVHEVEPGQPEECVGLLQNGLVTDAMELMASMPRYRQFVAQADMKQTYAYYFKQLQLLQWRESRGHWVLKSPYHQRGLPALLEQFPDALIVQTHRDPCNVAPSFCSLYQVLHELTTDNPVPQEQGALRLNWLAEVNEITLSMRKQYGPDRFVDVGLTELMRDPIAVVHRIYERAGKHLSGAAEEQMRSWYSANPQHKRGIHRYTLDEFGLSVDMVRSRLKSYYEAYAEHLM